MRLPRAVARLLPPPPPLPRPGAALLPRRSAARASEQVENKTKGKPQKQICQVVLDHFEKQYTTELGHTWTSVRDVLTYPLCWQYAILLNKFSQSSELENTLGVKGYHPAFQGPLPYLPALLKCYIRRTPGRFPAQKHQAGKLKEYYLLNAASLLPVLALEVKDGEDVLDLCAAPGGKSIAILQCAYPGQFHCNEYDDLRSRWLKQTIESFIPYPLINVITVSKLDGRQIGDLKPELYEKVLVDAPCSNDRSWLFSSDIQQAMLRLMQRKELPSLQFQLLRVPPEWDGHQPPFLFGLQRCLALLCWKDHGSPSPTSTEMRDQRTLLALRCCHVMKAKMVIGKGLLLKHCVLADHWSILRALSQGQKTAM